MTKPQPKTLLAVASAAMMIAAAACGRPSLAPATRIGGASVAQAPSAADQSQAAGDGQAASSPTTASASPTVGASSGGIQIQLNSGNSQAQYQTQEQLAGHNLPNTAVGTTTGVSGSIALTSNGQLDAANSKITVDLTSLKSDESMRDQFVQRNTLQTSQFPSAIFTPTQITGLSSIPTAGSAIFQLSGNLTVHGFTKPITWTVNATFDGQQVSGKATAPFTITEFGMSLPKAGPVLSVQDAGTLELDFTNAAPAS